MSQGTTIYDLHGRLLLDTFDRNLSDGDAFLIFALFHHYQIELEGPFLLDRPTMSAGDRVAADTQRGSPRPSLSSGRATSMNAQTMSTGIIGGMAIGARTVMPSTSLPRK